MKQFCTRAGVVVLIFCLIMLFGTRQYVKIAQNEPVDIYVDVLEDAEPLKVGMAIDTDLFMLMECFGYEETTTKNRSGAVTDKDMDYYYILPIPVGEEDTYFVACKVSTEGKDFRNYDNLAEATMEYIYMESDIIDAEEFHISGGLISLDEELYGYMKEWFEETEWFENEADIDKYVLPLTFTPVNAASTMNAFYITLGVLGADVVILAILLIGDLRYRERRKHMAALKNKQINIAGRDYCVALMDVDRMIWAGKLQKAKKELMKTYKATEEEADAIINNWDQITAL